MVEIISQRVDLNTQFSQREDARNVIKLSNTRETAT
jgi:hypothetical protein